MPITSQDGLCKTSCNTTSKCTCMQCIFPQPGKYFTYESEGVLSILPVERESNGKIISIWKVFKNGQSKNLWKSAFKKIEPFKIFKGCLPQILLGPFLNTLSQNVTSVKVHVNWLNWFHFLILLWEVYCNRLSIFTVTIPRCHKDFRVKRFFLRTTRPYNTLLVECFPLTCEHNCFTSWVNWHLSSLGYL